jgi:putative flippase GtrA
MIMKYLLVGAGAAFVGMLPLPIDAYHLIRWIVAGTCAFGSYELFQRKSEDKSTAVLLAISALVYNPIAPFYLNRGLWLIVDLIVGGFLLWIVFRGNTLSSDKADFSARDMGEQIDEKLAQIEEKTNGFMSRMLVSGGILLVVVVIINFVMKK